MRKVYEMPSNFLKVWKDKEQVVLCVRECEINLSEWEVDDLIITLHELQRLSRPAITPKESIKRRETTRRRIMR